jgi:hypothetical protein
MRPQGDVASARVRRPTLALLLRGPSATLSSTEARTVARHQAGRTGAVTRQYDEWSAWQQGSLLGSCGM